VRDLFIHIPSCYQHIPRAHARVFLLPREIQNMGLICHVDLFPVPSSATDSASTNAQPQNAPPTNYASSSSTVSPAPYSPQATQYPYTFPAPQPPPPGAGVQATPGPVHQPYGSAPVPPTAPLPADIVYYHKDYPIAESSKCTESLAGTTFVQAANLDYKGNKVLMFVFSVRIFPYLCFIGTDQIRITSILVRLDRKR
jgi:hypothetical protein